MGLGAALLLASTGCGGAEFRYLESTDGHMFAKVPHDWEVVREGNVTFKYLADENPDFVFAPGDSTFPWRAEFRANDGTNLQGYIEGQHIDARTRSSILLRDLIDLALLRARVAEAERVKVSVGDVEGYRVTYSVPTEDGEVLHDEVWLIDDRRSGVYNVSMSCDAACFDEHRDVIDEVLTTFRVEQ